MSIGPPTVEEGPHADPRQVKRATGAAVVAVLAFAVGPIMLKEASLEALAFAFWRLWLAAVVYVGFLYFRGKRLNLQIMKTAAPGGIAFGVDIALFFSAVKLTSVINATLIATLQPIPLMIVGQVWFGERVRRSDVVWTAAAIGGVMIVVIAGQDATTGNLSGDILAILAMFAFAAYFVGSKYARRTLDTSEYMAAMMLIAAGIVSPIALLSGQSLIPGDWETWLLIAAVVAVPGSGHVLNNYALKYLPLLVVSLLTLASPVVSIILAWLLLDEGLVLLQVVGIVVVLGSLSMFTVLHNREA